MSERVGLDDFWDIPDESLPSELPNPFDDDSDDPTVTFTEFVARRDEDDRDPLITAEQGTLLPAAGLVILAAKTGDGKTTLMAEGTLHAGAGLDYLGLSFPRPLRMLVIENEGPREAFREKLAARVVHWEHGGEPRIWDVPAEWGQVRLSDPAIRARLRAVVEQHRIDLIVSDSLTRFGMRGNGTPEETREFVEWMAEIGLGRDVGFWLLHHPRTRTDPGEDELERIAGAWPPHADLILLLKRLDGGRARLSFPKTRWAKAQRPASILGFDPETETFTYIRDDVPEERDLVAELTALMADGEWWTVNALRKSKTKGGVGAEPDAIKLALSDERFQNASGAWIDRRKDATYYRLQPEGEQASPPPTDASHASALLPEGGKRGSVSPSKRELGETLAASLRRDAFDTDASTAEEAEVERLASLLRADEEASS